MILTPDGDSLHYVPRAPNGKVIEHPHIQCAIDALGCVICCNCKRIQEFGADDDVSLKCWESGWIAVNKNSGDYVFNVLLCPECYDKFRKPSLESGSPLAPALGVISMGAEVGRRVGEIIRNDTKYLMFDKRDFMSGQQPKYSIPLDKRTPPKGS